MSAAEFALFSLSRFQLRHLRDHFAVAYKNVRRLLADTSGLLLTILVGNEMINISLSTIITKNISPLIPEEWANAWVWQMVLSALITTPIVLIFCEVTPKVLGAQINSVIAPLVARPLLAIYKIFLPVRYGIQVVIQYLLRWLENQTGAPANDHSLDKKLQEDEFMLLLEEGQKEGMVHRDELELIRNVFQLDDTKIESIATPIATTHTLSRDLPLTDASIVIKRRRYNRIPVHGSSKKEIIGILYSKDLLFNRDRDIKHVGEIVRAPLFVTGDTKVKTVFKRMRENQTHIAIVKNLKGEVTGVVTMRDILDEIFEDLFPDSTPPVAKQIRATS